MCRKNTHHFDYFIFFCLRSFCFTIRRFICSENPITSPPCRMKSSSSILSCPVSKAYHKELVAFLVLQMCYIEWMLILVKCKVCQKISLLLQRCPHVSFRVYSKLFRDFFQMIILLYFRVNKGKFLE